MRRLAPALTLVLTLVSPALAEEGGKPLATFEKQTPGRPPDGWKARGGEASDVYVVRQEGDRKYLRADARGVSIQIGNEETFDVKRYPILTWRWRVLALPEGANEKDKDKGDSAAGVYVVFGGWPVPNTIKYVWSTSLSPGTRLESPFADQTKIVVLRSGTSHAGQWVEEQVNVLEDYRTLFGKDPDEARGIGILSDADNTKSRAVADYNAIVARAAGASTSGSASGSTAPGK